MPWKSGYLRKAALLVAVGVAGLVLAVTGHMDKHEKHSLFDTAKDILISGISIAGGTSVARARYRDADKPPIARKRAVLKRLTDDVEIRPLSRRG